MDCAQCGRDLYKYGYTTGNTLDGYSTTSQLCKDCNRKLLRSRGMGALAAKDERDDRIVAAFLGVLKWGFIALLLIVLLGAAVDVLR